jgi:hypothetical protein
LCQTKFHTHTKHVLEFPTVILVIRTSTCVSQFSAQTEKFVLSIQMSRLLVFRASSASLLWPPVRRIFHAANDVDSVSRSMKCLYTTYKEENPPNNVVLRILCDS